METPQAVASTLPHLPGVYLFKNISGIVIYVGKAKDLRRRVIQYFRPDLIDIKTKILVSQINSIEIITTLSEFDAILLEAKLIQDYAPKYNIILKDNKSSLYVLLTIRERLPHVIFLRGREVKKTEKQNNIIFGPFQSSRIAQTIMKQLRYTVPYCMQKQRNGKPCFYTHLGLCKPCPSVITAMSDSEDKMKLIQEYRLHIFRLRDILTGKSRHVLTVMEKERSTLAGKQRFEEASELNQQITQLNALITKQYDPMIYLETNKTSDEIAHRELSDLYQLLKIYLSDIQSLSRIECVDISNMQGHSSGGSLVVLTNGVIDKSQYKRFRIRNTKTPNDVAMIHEVILRRLSHPEWGLPSLMIIDGGKGQVDAARIAMKQSGYIIPVIVLAKRLEEIIIPVPYAWKILQLPLTRPGLHVLQRIRDESHRFALAYHKHLRKKAFLSSINGDNIV